MSFYDDAFIAIKNFKPKIKDISIKSYLSNIKKISLDLFNSTKPSLQYFKDHSNIIKYLDNINSLASRKNILTSILVLVKANSNEYSPELIKIYNDYHQLLSKEQENFYLDNMKSEKEEKNWITRNDIQNKITELETIYNSKISKRKFIDFLQQHLVLNLYTLLPPLRNDYVLVKVIDNEFFENNEDIIDRSYNYINLYTKRLLLCKYKTDKYYGIKKIDLPDQLYNIIINWEKEKKKYFNDKLHHDFLLLNSTNGENMKRNSLTKYINKIFHPKKVSTTLLRKIYLSEKYPVINTYREQAYDAFVMGHDVTTQKMIYSKK